jgi:hypothetical protein
VSDRDFNANPEFTCLPILLPPSVRRHQTNASRNSEILASPTHHPSRHITQSYSVLQYMRSVSHKEQTRKIEIYDAIFCCYRLPTPSISTPHGSHHGDVADRSNSLRCLPKIVLSGWRLYNFRPSDGTKCS